MTRDEDIRIYHQIEGPPVVAAMANPAEYLLDFKEPVGIKKKTTPFKKGNKTKSQRKPKLTIPLKPNLRNREVSELEKKWGKEASKKLVQKDLWAEPAGDYGKHIGCSDPLLREKEVETVELILKNIGQEKEDWRLGTALELIAGTGFWTNRVLGSFQVVHCQDMNNRLEGLAKTKTTKFFKNFL